MKVSIDKINELRKITGIGIMDCKVALINSNGNIEKAILILRKKGEKIAVDRSLFQMKEGAVISCVNSDYSYGTIIGLSCETDFLSKNLDFLDFLSILSKQSLLYNNKKDFLNSSYKDHNYEYENIEKMIINKMGVVGEKLELKIFEKIMAPFVMDYTHNNKIATLIGFSTKIDKNVAKNIAMHVTAMNPISIDKNGIPNSLMKKEIEIFKSQVEKEKKQENIMKKIILGKVEKFISENTLLNQKFIKNNKITVQEYLKKYNNKLKINLFKRINI
ncbi:translation elongation factor Ts [Blattabacterium cuenoti]|uniref:translation elongation factor Ts n=1 Tax=Blattabacterium cuenoti TaxID=1653831 RepID=UPI00163D2AD9|nr:translation elongation factor Ts [Blattabacterium cuenoti]